MVMALQSLAASTGSQSRELSLYRAQLLQARREVNQAERRVTQLEQETSAARQDATRAHGRVRDAEGNRPQPDETQRPQTQSTRKTVDTVSQLHGTLVDETV